MTILHLRCNADTVFEFSVLSGDVFLPLLSEQSVSDPVSTLKVIFNKYDPPYLEVPLFVSAMVCHH